MPLPTSKWGLHCRKLSWMRSQTKLVLITIVLFMLFTYSFFSGDRSFRYEKQISAFHSDQYSEWGTFTPLPLSGFINTGLPGKESCDSLKRNGTVGVQQSLHLPDNITSIALALDAHPMVHYPEDLMNNKSLTVQDITERTWARLSGSSVWLPDQKVYLLVTRVIFHSTRSLSEPIISFLRGQLFDKDWKHLDNYTVTWRDTSHTFPLLFDIPIEYEIGGCFYGAEDPRIILEEGVEDAEPLIIYNMIAARSEWKRAMYIFRPFSNQSNILTIPDQQRSVVEKNWAPLFIPSENTISNKPRQPNEYIHFVYDFKPLRVLRCHLHCGSCEFVFEQKVPEGLIEQHNEDGSSLRGGTNWVPVPIRQNTKSRKDIRVWAAFPRTVVEKRCGGRFYRPQFAVMVNVGSEFHLAFAGEPMDFGTALFELQPEDDPCEKGRILLPNSIARWDTSPGADVMSITFSVNDATVQLMKVQGLLEFIRSMPQLQHALEAKALQTTKHEDDLRNMISSWMTAKLRSCAVESAINFAMATKRISSHSKASKPEPHESTELLFKLYEEEKSLPSDHKKEVNITSSNPNEESLREESHLKDKMDYTEDTDP